MLTPEEKRAQREWRKSQLTEDERLLKRALNRERRKKKAELLRERKIINGWDE